MNNVRRIYFTFCALSAVLAVSALSAQERSSQNQQVETTLREYWALRAEPVLGFHSYTKWKSSFDWPCILQDVTPGSTGVTYVYKSEADLDKSIRYGSADTDAIGSEFNLHNLKGSDIWSRVTLSNFNIQFVNDKLANVTYALNFPDHSLSENRRKPASAVSMLANLRWNAVKKAWKISYLTTTE